MAEFGHEYSNTLNPTVLGEGSNRLSWPTPTSYCTWATSPTLRTAPHGQPQDGGNNVLVSEEGTSGCVDPSRLQINPSNIRPPGRFWSSYHLDFLVSCYSPPSAASTGQTAAYTTHLHHHAESYRAFPRTDFYRTRAA
jgi:hypothetical protein